MPYWNRMPYTDIHNLNLDWLINAMKELQEEWKHYGGTLTATAHNSNVPEVIVTGDFRTTVNFDFGLVKGPTGATGATGAPGPQGTPGAGLEIKDKYATLQELEAAHPVGEPGDAYLIGTTDFSLYIWSESAADYVYGGSLTSPSPSTLSPTMDGVGATGIEQRYARGDHQHPSDTAKLDKQTNDGTKVEVYAFAGNAQNAIEVTDTPTAGKIPMYDQVSGNINTGAAVSGGEAVNLNQLGDTLAPINTSLANKQEKLIGGTNIALINGLNPLTNTYIGIKSVGGESLTYTAGEPDNNVPLKTINNESIIGSGNIAIAGGGVKTLSYPAASDGKIPGGGTFTAPADGVFVCEHRAGMVQVNGTAICSATITYTAGYVPLKSGDVVSITAGQSSKDYVFWAYAE